MSQNDQETSWAKTLQTDRHTTAHMNAADWAMKAVGIAKDIAEGKRMLKQSVTEKNTASIETNTKALIRLRAEQLACVLHQYRQQTETEDPNFLARLIAQYKKDCHDLIASVDILQT